MENCKKKKGKAGKAVLIILCVLLALILLALIFAWVYMDRMLGLINYQTGTVATLSSSELHEIENPTETIEPGDTSPVLDPTDVTFPTEPAEVIESDNIINILLIGQDRRSGQSRQRSDAMILCTINKEKKSLTMTSFLRDMYVQIPGYRSNKINAAYQIGGMELLDATLEVNFGVQVDGNVEVDFSQFSQIIDLVGGVDIYLTGAEAKYMGNGLQTGVNHLDGKLALAYSRIRYLDSDFGRTNRQRTVLTALVDQCRNASLAQLHKLLSGVLGLITTDMTEAEIMGYAVELFPLLKDLTITTQYVPMEGSYTFGHVGSIPHCILVDFEKNRQLIAETLAD